VPDVGVAKETGAPKISAGGSAVYNITVTNKGPDPADNVTLRDTLPNGEKMWLVSGEDAEACSPSSPIAGGMELVCTFGTLAPGAERNITLTVDGVALANNEQCGAKLNTATVTADGEAASNLGNNTAGPVTIQINCPDVLVTKTASVETVAAGEDAVFDITVTNLGPGIASNVTLSDSLPNGGTVGGDDAEDCAIEVDELTCNFGDLEPDETRSVTLTIPTTEADCPVVENTATVTADNEDKASLENNESSASIDVTCPGTPTPTSTTVSEVSPTIQPPATPTLVSDVLGPNTGTGSGIGSGAGLLITLAVVAGVVVVSAAGYLIRRPAPRTWLD
jgi:uncharacterized repeat protein (TIGR01451 family)